MKSFFTIVAIVISFIAVAQPKLVAHRGFYKTEGAEENTLSALHNAQKLNEQTGYLYGVEFDVNLTADNELIVFHGPMVAGTSYNVQKEDYTLLKNIVLKNGNHMPTLRQWLIEAKKTPNLKMILELKKHKTPQIETKICEMIVDLCKELDVLHQMEFTSFSEHACREFHRLSPSSPILFINSSLDCKIDAKKAIEYGFTNLSYSMYVYMNQPERIKQNRENGIASTLWIVDNEEVVDWAVKHHVEYVSSNYPDRIGKYLHSAKVIKAAKAISNK